MLLPVETMDGDETEVPIGAVEAYCLVSKYATLKT